MTTTLSTTEAEVLDRYLELLNADGPEEEVVDAVMEYLESLPPELREGLDVGLFLTQ